MNSTLGVALITALSTLAAGALASFTSLRIYRRQAKLQHDTTILEHQERENAQRRQLRRDAYLGLLTYCDELAAVFNECWGSKPHECWGSEQPGELYRTIGPLDKARLLLNSIETPLNTVYLEGPKSIMSAVGELKDALQDTFQKIIDLANANDGANDSLLHLAHKRGDFHNEPYTAAKNDFINAAREALGKTPLF